MKKYIILTFALHFTFLLSAQEMPAVEEVCGTMEQDRLNREKYPEMGTLEDFELILAQKIKERELRKSAGRTEAVIISIPVVFHVVHNGEATGSGTNLSELQIQSQIEVLNEDFRRLLGTNGYNNHPDGADIELEFCLTGLDEKGLSMAEPGIDRIRGNRSTWSKSEIEGELKPLSIWDPNYFFNVWTVDFGSKESTLLGYAQFPSSSLLQGLPNDGGSAATDGVVVLYSATGRGDFPSLNPDTNLGRVLTHEVGHWLGLRHIWGDGPCGSDDYCLDTPEADSENYGCPVGTISCGTEDMVRNYMDYTDNACMNIFTNDQKARMLAVMEISPRRNLLPTSSVCTQTVTEPPVANFTSDRTFSLLGGTVKFNDLSSNFPNEWHWEFEGGEPAISNSKNPIITYNTPGSFSVKLVSSNSLGNSDTLFIENYIEVSEQGLCNELSNFEGNTPTLLRPTVESGETGFIAGHNSNHQKAVSEFFSNEFGYVELSGALINFSYAYSQNQNARVKIVVWNALGPQNAPSRVLEEKEILISQIKQDIETNSATIVSFDRRIPIFLGTPFHIGIELEYSGDTIAITTSSHGEATKQTSWAQKADGTWQPYSLMWGLEVAHDIKALVGMKPSVHLAPSDLAVYAGNTLTMNASGASIFVWNSDDGTVIDHLGPQLKTLPRQKTTYTLKGSGLDLCYDETSFTIHMLETATGISEELNKEFQLYPNPVTDVMNVEMNNNFRGETTFYLYDLNGKLVSFWTLNKTMDHFSAQLESGNLKSGIYQLKIIQGNNFLFKKVLKY